MSLPIVERRFPKDPGGLLPAITPDNEKFWDALARGELIVQQCGGCARPRWPIAPVCPYCGKTEWSWRNCSGAGAVFSWVRYRRSYLPEFEDVMPYAVATVQLDEGVRMFGRMIDQKDDPVIGQKVTAVIERWPDGRCVPAFKVEGRT